MRMNNPASWKRECLEQINQLNIGPMGLKGRTTALKVNIEWFLTHIAGMPVAVNINCHVTRHKSGAVMKKIQLPLTMEDRRSLRAGAGAVKRCNLHGAGCGAQTDERAADAGAPLSRLI